MIWCCVFSKNPILIYGVVNMVLHDFAGCQEQECGAYIDTFWGSSLPDGLYGLCTGINGIKFDLTLQMITFIVFWN